MNTRKPDDLDNLIRQASQSDEQPSLELNNLLKAKLREKETQMLTIQSKKKISLWYLPMLLNSLAFTTLAFMLQVFIQNSIVLQIVTGVCIYLILAGIILTLAGIKLSNFKAAFTIELNKGGSLV